MKKIAVVGVALALALTACQSAAENIAENLTEQIVEASGEVGDVDIDIDSGEISIETDEGSITIGGGELPEDFDVPLPDGFEVTSVFTSDGSSSVTLTFPGGDFDNIVAHFEDWTSSQPVEWSNSSSSFSQGDGQTLHSASWTSDGSFITVTDCFTLDSDGSDFNAVCVNIIQE